MKVVYGNCSGKLMPDLKQKQVPIPVIYSTIELLQIHKQYYFKQKNFRWIRAKVLIF